MKQIETKLEILNDEFQHVHQYNPIEHIKPCDFVVIKATEGTGYVNPDYERAYRQAKTAGKCLGIYHYASGGNIQAEAEYFLKNAGSRVGEAMLVLDWEGRSNPAFGVNDREWVKAWCNYISTKTSVNPEIGRAHV